jgi:hypothetical protein
MKTGAVVREWPAGYSIWNEDTSAPEGYTLLQTYAKEPPRELVDALYDVSHQPYTSMTYILTYIVAISIIDNNINIISYHIISCHIM